MISASQKPVITHVLVIPDLDLSRRKDQSQDQIFPQKIVSVGLVLDGERVAWGDCVADGRDAIGHPPRFAAVDGAISIQESVVPALQGQSLSSFRELAAIVESLTEQVTITQSLPQPEPGASVKKISRRDLFTGRLWSPEPKPRTKQVIIERPLHPAIRFGVSQALLKAAAMTRNLTIAELIADEYGLSLPPSPVPIHLETSGDKDAINQALHLQVASVGYRLPGKEPIEELGNNGVILQQYARELGQQIAAAADYQPAIHLNVGGGLGALCADNVGKILGILLGFKQMAAARPMRIEDSLIVDGRSDQIEKMRQLKDYVRFRKIGVQLVANAWVNSLEDVKAFVQAEAAHMIHLHAPRLGSLSQTIEAVLYCRQQGVGVLLGDEDDCDGRLLTQVALAVQPDLVGGNTAVLHNEMARTLAWLASPDTWSNER